MSIRTSVLQDKKYIWYRGDSVRYLVVEIEGPPSSNLKVESTEPTAIVFDASESADASAIRAGEAIISELLDRLPRGDHASIVLYSRRGEGAVKGLEGRWGTAAPHFEVKPALGLVDAWLLGAELVARAMAGSKLPYGRVLLLQTSPDRDARAYVTKLGQIARGLEKRGIATTAIGVGSEVDPSCLIALDDTHGQQQIYAETPAESAQLLAANVFKIYPVVATDAVISLKTSPYVAVSPIDRFDEVEKGVGSISLGDLRAGAKYLAIFKLRFPSGDVGEQELVEVQIAWKESRKQQASHNVSFEFAPGPVNSPQPVDQRAALLVTQTWRNAILWHAYQLISEGHEDEADRIIKTQTLHLERYCRGQYQLRNQLVLLGEGLRTLGAA